MPLLFIYNADAGKLHAAIDVAHKLLSPGTYSCNLCQLTHGLLREHRAWAEFKKRAKEELVFYHKDEFEAKYDFETTYPVILLLDNGELSVHTDTKTINSFTTFEQLIEHLE